MLALVGAALGWRPPATWPLGILALALGTAAFAGIGLALAGRLPALANLAATNSLYLVLLLIGYHFYCGRMLAHFERDAPTPGHVWFRWFNEAPVLMLLAAVILVVVKPF